ncbi:ubiquitin-conjugating enzyme E2 J1 [Folsomia candida]|uniref:Ubiquitin-conjugating enzyme E2 J1 n=1 Tax=Folsomia candida TaxID=158441 RepID=A0A226E574_FOLCA|nr:ubiquitin-conjugating enzyme E2 J1 [Folsomia candida]OXA52842.1 Ubiquitin-conjugating enzyme E2 J1 [Folsomia candida]
MSGSSPNVGGLSNDPLNTVGDSSPPPLDSQTMTARYNQRNPAVKRLMREAAEMAVSDERWDIDAKPLDDNLFEWHFTFRGPPETVYSRGVYHGRVIFPSQYPLTPPEIAILTPNGRFETGTKICLSISNHHPETWLPSWSIRTAITALRAFMASDSPGAIGSLQCSDQARRQMATESMSYNCSSCGHTTGLLAPMPEPESNSTVPQEKNDALIQGNEQTTADNTISSGVNASPTTELDAKSITTSSNEIQETRGIGESLIIPNEQAEQALVGNESGLALPDVNSVGLNVSPPSVGHGARQVQRRVLVPQELAEIERQQNNNVYITCLIFVIILAITVLAILALIKRSNRWSSK